MERYESIRESDGRMGKGLLAGHVAAFLTIVIWGTTFIATKVLLRVFTPVEILFFRFLVGFIALCLACPRRLKTKSRAQEAYLASAGLCGVTLYFLLENIALQFTLASNVGVIISVAPFFTAIFGYFFLKAEKPVGLFFVGFLAAMAGIYLLSFGGGSYQLNPLGDVLAFLAAVVWAAYSTLTKKISSFGFHTILTTRRTFFYGLIFMIPALSFMDFNLGLHRFFHMKNLLNILFLGLGASALCFVTWNFAVKTLGSVKTSVYIYIVPVVTVATSAIILDERVTAAAKAGIILTLAGLFISEYKPVCFPPPYEDKNVGGRSAAQGLKGSEKRRRIRRWIHQRLSVLW